MLRATPVTSARSMSNKTARTTRLMAALLFAMVLVTGCGTSKPAKYRKKRDCDCPKWNQVPTANPTGIHASAATWKKSTYS